MSVEQTGVLTCTAIEDVERPEHAGHQSGPENGDRPIPSNARFLNGDDGFMAASRFRRSVKGTIDRIGAAMLLGVLSPLMAVIAFLIRMSSPGPALFRQERVGRNGRTFHIFKFRTMHTDAEEKQTELNQLNEQDGPVFKIRDDPRVTNLGRYLRRLSLDELPQLINVLGGEMSLVGPRPPLPDEVASYNDWELQRLHVKPGLTCTWQVSGRSEVDFQTWMKMDIDYIGDWSLTTDLKLLAKTLPAVVKRDGAY
ncbi:MAG: sugar transferase [Acidimicrobiia bacterium]